MRQALAEWAQPAAVTAGARAAGNAGTLVFLLRRVRRRTDFPALSSAVTRIQRIASSERDSPHTLAEEILKDVALTNRLLRDPRADVLVGRFGLGEGAAELAPCCRVALKPAPGSAPDLFTTVCLCGADTLISDAGAESIATRLPDWPARRFGARAFVLLPMMLKGAAFGLIYADKPDAGSIQLDEKALNLLRTLRNQAVMAFRQKS